jgi:hypothetical protein
MNMTHEDAEKLTAKAGDKIALSKGTFARIQTIKNGVAYYGNHEHVRLADLVASPNTFSDCWEIKS